MTDISQLVGGAETAGGLDSQALFGLISRPPLTWTDGMNVIVPSFSSEFGFEVLPGRWQPRAATVPNKYDQCLVILDDNSDAWVPIWAPRQPGRTSLPSVMFQLPYETRVT